jgi:hypothetical protein
MYFDRFAGLLAAAFLCLTLAIVAWTGVAGPIWRAHDTASPDQWLGFAGAVLGGFATLFTGGAALFAAYKTLVPMRDQLNQLIRQNDHNLHDGLRRRASDLNDEIILIEQICSTSKIVDQALRSATQANPSIYAFGNFEASVDRFNTFVGDLQKRRGRHLGIASNSIRSKDIHRSLLDDGCDDGSNGNGKQGSAISFGNNSQKRTARVGLSPRDYRKAWRQAVCPCYCGTRPHWRGDIHIGRPNFFELRASWPNPLARNVKTKGHVCSWAPLRHADGL